jgi:hypothetical protein
MFRRRPRTTSAGAAEQSAAPAPPESAAPAPRILQTIITAAAMAGVLASGMLVWGSSTALFNGNTANPANSWSAGTVSISDDDSAAAMFTTTGILPGDTGQKCITVTYTGSVTAGVKVYGALTGTLGPYVDLTIEQGTGGSFASCTGFASALSTTATMSAFAAASSNYGTGFGTWAPTANGQTRVYRVTWALRPDNGAISKTAGLTLTWEAQG